MDAIAAANDMLRDKGYVERDLAVHAGPRGKALLKGNKIISPFSDDAELVLRVVSELVPSDAELGSKLLRPADLRAKLSTGGSRSRYAPSISSSEPPWSRAIRRATTTSRPFAAAGATRIPSATVTLIGPSCERAARTR